MTLISTCDIVIRQAVQTRENQGSHGLDVGLRWSSRHFFAENGKDVVRPAISGLQNCLLRLIADFSTENEKDASNRPVLRTC